MKVKFLMIARVLYDKGYKEYVEASKIIHKDSPETEFLLLGGIDEDYPDAVPKEVIDEDHSAGHINYLGYRKDVREIIKDADCIVLPSFYNEGLSRVLMEGLAMRKPIITSTVPGCKETVDDGINGYLCKPRDVRSLADCMEKFLHLTPEQRLKMGEKGREKAESRFDIKNVINVYESITHKYEK